MIISIHSEVDEKNKQKQDIINKWLQYTYSSAFIEYQLGLIDYHEYFKRGLYE